ncbi:MAG: adenylyl-sulfate kinase [Deltaproteobacteria bacterium]|nr:adenylyl-sulfate kinase [Deltaproteobacteria bacterium]
MTPPPPAVGRALWLVGVPASGKTTLARAIIARLRHHGVCTLWLDSDDLRRVLTPSPSYDDEERDQFYRAIVHLAKLGVDGGATVVISATAHQRTWRESLRNQVNRLDEVWLAPSRDVVMRRDPKGLYRAAEAGEIDSLPGVDVAFEPPIHPALVFDTGAMSVEDMADVILARMF